MAGSKDMKVRVSWDTILRVSWDDRDRFFYQIGYGAGGLVRLPPLSGSNFDARPWHRVQPVSLSDKPWQVDPDLTSCIHLSEWRFCILQGLA